MERLSSRTRAGDSLARAVIEFRGATFESPASWEQESLLGFSPGGPPPRPTLTLSRVTDPGDEALDSLLAKRVAGVSSELAAVEILDASHVPLAGGQSASARLSFEELEGRYTLRMLLVKTAGKVYALTGQALMSRAHELDAAFDHVAGSLRTSAAPRP